MNDCVFRFKNDNVASMPNLYNDMVDEMMSAQKYIRELSELLMKVKRRIPSNVHEISNQAETSCIDCIETTTVLSNPLNEVKLFWNIPLDSYIINFGNELYHLRKNTILVRGSKGTSKCMGLLCEGHCGRYHDKIDYWKNHKSIPMESTRKVRIQSVFTNDINAIATIAIWCLVKISNLKKHELEV